MTAVATSMKNATLVDFTGTLSGFRDLPGFGPEFVELVRKDERRLPLVLVDFAVGGNLKQPAVVRDHLNLTGTSPLLGPNHPLGERFPVVQGIYIDDLLPSLSRVVAAGLKQGVPPSADDLQLVKQYGADVCCYNIVPAMLVAAHARCRVLAIVLPESSKLPDAVLSEIRSLTGEGK